MDLKDVENPNTWKGIIPNFNVSPLEDVESDVVSVKCINSSEFVVGRQTNFNGPVTIINYEHATPSNSSITINNSNDDGDGDNVGKNNKEGEKIIIRDKVLSESAAKKMKEMAFENSLKNCKYPILIFFFFN